MKDCAVKRPKLCAGGEHLFIVSRWHLTGIAQNANGYTCQKCLLTVDGKHDIDKLRDRVHAKLEEDNKPS